MATEPEPTEETSAFAGDAETPIGRQTAEYLDDKAEASFKRQTDLEESIWRSVPLFTGGLLAAGAIIATAARALPPPRLSLLVVATYLTLGLATFAFTIAFWWLWQVVKPREFDYPAGDEAIGTFAGQMTQFHRQSGLTGERLDDAVVHELRLYMTRTLGIAATSSLANNQARLSARSQVLLFLLIGFLLAFVSDAIIFGHEIWVGAIEGASADAGRSSGYDREREERGAAASDSAADASDTRRGLADQVHHRAADTR